MALVHEDSRIRHDAAIADATQMVAKRLCEVSDAGVQALETKHMQPAFRAALREIGAGEVDRSEVTIRTPNWSPSPGGVDILVRDRTGQPSIAAELKLHDVHWMLWDALKMIDLWQCGKVSSAYIVLGMIDSRWDYRFRKCRIDGTTTELLNEGASIHDTAELFQRNAHAWYDMLTDSSARPVRVPKKIRTIHIADPEVKFTGNNGSSRVGSIRVMRVEPASNEWLDFSPDWYIGEWPVGVLPCDHYLEWRDLPRQDEPR